MPHPIRLAKERPVDTVIWFAVGAICWPFVSSTLASLTGINVGLPRFRANVSSGGDD
jgi:hypothetical protein